MLLWWWYLRWACAPRSRTASWSGDDSSAAMPVDRAVLLLDQSGQLPGSHGKRGSMQRLAKAGDGAHLWQWKEGCKCAHSAQCGYAWRARHGGNVLTHDVPRFGPQQCSACAEIAPLHMASETDTVRVAAVGCCHGELDTVYETLKEAEAASGGKPVDLVLICGDFEAMRNEADLECMACPPKYRAMGDFWAYYSGAKVAPVPTIIIGGNHEASAYFQTLPYGGFVAPNMYFMGYAGVVQFGGLRIGGLSGIYERRDYCKPHFEAPPYDRSSMRSVYHSRERDVWRLAHVGSPLDAFLSHDWPAGIDRVGDHAWLMRKKKHFRADSAKGELGSPALWDLLAHLRPACWFAAHLHVKFPALVQHTPPLPLHAAHSPSWLVQCMATAGAGQASQPAHTSQEGRRAEAAPPGTEHDQSGPPQAQADAPLFAGHASTRFLALDKPLPGRGFLQVLDICPSELREGRLSPAGQAAREPTQRKVISFDPEWCAIVAATHTIAMQQGRGPPLSPPAPPSQEEVDAAKAALVAAFGAAEDGSVPIPPTPRSTAPAFVAPEGYETHYDAKAAALRRQRQGAASAADALHTEWGYPGPRVQQPGQEGNAFTDDFLAALALPHLGTVSVQQGQAAVGRKPPAAAAAPDMDAAFALASTSSKPVYGNLVPVQAMYRDAPAPASAPEPAPAPQAWADEAELDIDDL